MTVQDSAAHKPEAQAKVRGTVRLRLRLLVCCKILHADLVLKGSEQMDRDGRFV
jgi:hypothetical protein